MAAMLPLDDLRQRVQSQVWTSHNVRLTPDLETMPGQPGFLETDLRLHAIQRTLRTLFHGHLASRRVADLGCLEGGFALALAQQGCHVLGIEARQKNLDKALLLKEHFALPNLEFRLGDVKAFTRERFGTFDAVLALGILYHLDDPVAWLAQIGAATAGVLVVETHYAPDDGADLGALTPAIAHLGPIERREAAGWTIEGRWFDEYEQTADRESQVWASYSNHRSFWLTKASLLQAIRRAGFDLVVEQLEYTADFYPYFTREFVRGLFVGVKSSAFAPR
jgi:SAM-dependent methyltransferase